jgi:spore coat polysaccharide biosynthesis protein SpsF (cytidylyltransferase family)
MQLKNKNTFHDFAIIIQVRSGSTRLQKKMFLPFFNNKTILEIIIEKILPFFDKTQIIIATTTHNNDDKFEELSIKYGVNIFRGEENNVLKRFIDTSRFFNRNKIIRICADNPFLDIELLTNLLNNVTHEIDYCSYIINDTPAIKTHFGFFSEYLTLNTLEKITKLTKDPLYLEHVTNFIYSTDSFKIKWIKSPLIIENSTNIRLTVDTISDFEICQKVYSDMYKKYKNKFGYNEIINYTQDETSLNLKMKANIKDNEK